MSEPLPMPMIGARAIRWISWVLGASIAIYILIPVLVTLVSSFSAGQQMRLPIERWSFAWYTAFASSPQWTDALKNSLIIAGGTTLLSTSAGCAAAYGMTRSQLRFSDLVYVVVVLPLFMPGVVLGLGIALTFNQLDLAGFNLSGSYILVIIAHSLWAMPLVFLPMASRYRRNLVPRWKAMIPAAAGPLPNSLPAMPPMSTSRSLRRNAPSPDPGAT